MRYSKMKTKTFNSDFIARKIQESVLVDVLSLRSGILFRNSSILKNSNAWHAFILHCPKGQEYLDRNTILKIVLDHAYPLDLVPVKFQTRGNSCMFLARNCSEVIEKICKDNLIIPNPTDPMSPIRCEIILQYSTINKIKVDVQKNISSVLHTLFDPTTKTLNLDKFCSNPELSEYCPLSQPKIMYFVLHLASGLFPTCIRMMNNDIHSLFPMEALWSSSTLSQLDMRNNRIDNMSSLESLKMLKLTELWLDGNPLCNDHDEYSYVEQIKTFLPKLERLDGVLLAKNGAPAFRRNFLCDHDGFDLVDQFLEHYFPLYDSDRKSLEGLYHVNAFCSITNLYKNGQSTSSGARLRPYQINSRNLLAMADLSRSQQYLIQGNNHIIRKLLDLPRTEHDPFSLTADLIFYSEKCAVITISGVFREIPDALLELERLLGFCRTFVLTGSKGEYVIANDMLHVYNALTTQITKAFSIPKFVKNQSLPPPITFKEKEKAVSSLMQITGIKRDWSRRLLEDAHYDLTACIRTFVDLYKIDKLPVDAFEK